MIRRIDETIGSGANCGSGTYLLVNAPSEEVIHMLGIDELFKGRHFDREIIILCVRWYLRGLPPEKWSSVKYGF
jgi:hypothetical protein